MELWFSDYHTEDVKLDIKIEKQLFGAYGFPKNRRF